MNLKAKVPYELAFYETEFVNKRQWDGIGDNMFTKQLVHNKCGLPFLVVMWLID